MKIKETFHIPDDILHGVLEGSWSQNLISIRIFYVDSDGKEVEVKSGSGRIYKDASSGFLYLEMAAHSAGIKEVVEWANYSIGDQELDTLGMSAEDEGGCRWSSSDLILSAPGNRFHSGMAFFRYRLGEVARGPRAPLDGIKEARVIYESLAGFPFVDISELTVRDPYDGGDVTHGLHDRLHFGDETWQRVFISRIGGYSECIISRKRAERKDVYLPCYIETLIDSCVTTAFKMVCEWTIAYYSTDSSQTIIIREGQSRVKWSSNFPIFNYQHEQRGWAGEWLRVVYNTFLYGGRNGDLRRWDIRSRIMYSVISNERWAEMPTQLAVLGAAVEAMAKECGAEGEPRDDDLNAYGLISDAISANLVPGVNPGYANKIRQHKVNFKRPSMNSLIRSYNDGSRFDFSDKEKKAFSIGRNAPAHGEWPEHQSSLGNYYHMLNMFHKELLRSLCWRGPFQLYSQKGYRLYQERVGQVSDPVEIQEWIQLEAYLISKRRSIGGDSLLNWLEGEAHVRGLLG